MRLVAAFLLLVAAGGFAYLAARGIGDDLLDVADKVAGVISLVLALLLLWNPFGWLSDSSEKFDQTATGGDGAVIVQQGNDGSVTVGDLTTSAEQRYETALSEIEGEYLAALSVRIAELEAVLAIEPEVFWDERRPNETNLAHEERAKAEFDRYIADVEMAAGLFAVEETVFQARRIDLGHDPSTSTRISNGYNHLRSAHDAFTDAVGLVAGLRSISRKSSLGDESRVEEARWLWIDKTLSSEVSLTQSMAEIVVVRPFAANPIVADHANRLGVTLDLADPGSWRATLFEHAAGLSSQRTQHLADRAIPGTSPTSSVDAEERSNSAQALFEEAALSFLEQDGSAAAGFFRKAIDTGQLSETLEAFARQSIRRLESPDEFGDSIGLFVLQVDEGRLGGSGVELHDTIIAIGGIPADEVSQLTTAFLGDEPVPLTIMRGSVLAEVSVVGTGPGGVVVSQLVIFAAQQIWFRRRLVERPAALEDPPSGRLNDGPASLQTAPY